MEDFRQQGSHKRKGSMPLVIVDKSNTKFRIYDRNFPVQDFQEQQEGGKKASDDRRVAPPPEFYPYNELESVIEEAQIKLRMPSSLRYQTEYVSKIGQHLQDILNRQHVKQ